MYGSIFNSFSRNDRLDRVDACFLDDVERVIKGKDNNAVPPGQGIDMFSRVDRQLLAAGSPNLERYERLGEFQLADFFDYFGHGASGQGFGSANGNYVQAGDEVEQAIIIQDEDTSVCGGDNSVFAGRHLELATIAGSDFKCDEGPSC